MKFEIDQVVRIGDVIASKYCEQLGTICEAMPHRRGKTSLDKYSVEFSNGARSVFWSIQLSPAELIPASRPTSRDIPRRSHLGNRGETLQSDSQIG